MPTLPSTEFVAGQNFSKVWNWIIYIFRYFFRMQSNIKIFGDFSLLDFNVAIIIFGIMFAVLFTVVRSGVNNSISGVDRHRRDKEIDRRAAARRGKK